MNKMNHSYDDYLGSDEENQAFLEWYEDNVTDLNLEELNDESHNDLIDEFRDTQTWTDKFLDWEASQK